MKKRIAAALLAALMIVCALPVFAATTADTSWYSDSKTEFTLTTPEQLLGLAKLSADGKTFKDKTILLGKDIALNEGTVTSAAPANVWTPMVNFAGTIDGKGYTISGLYATGPNTVGFISKADGATIRNLSITNSYFATTEGNTVSAFIAQGATAAALTIEKCYTDATLVSEGYNAGGFVSSVGSAAKTNVSECWFDGQITLKIRYAAAIVANGEGKEVTVSHCLNTGTVHTSYNSGTNSHVASMIGRNDGKSFVIDCLNLGKISSAKTEAGSPDEMGVLFGRASGAGVATIRNSAALEGTAPKDNLLGTALGGLTVENVGDGESYSSEEELTGFNATASTSLDFENYWTVVKGDFPQLRVFADTVIDAEIPEFVAPEFVENQIRVTENYGLRFVFRMECEDLENVELGALVIPTKAYKKAQILSFGMDEVTVGEKTYAYKDVPAAILWNEGEGFVEYTAVITDIQLEDATAGFVARPYAKYQVEGEEVICYGEAVEDSISLRCISYYDSASEEEKAAFDAVAFLKELYERFDGFAVREGWSTEDAWATVPAFIGGTLSDPFTVGEDRYDLDCDAYRIDDVTLQMYKDYLASLQKAGFTLYTTNGNDGINKECYQATLYSKDQTLNVSYYTNTKQVYVTVEAFRALSDIQLEKDYSADFIKDQSVELKMLPLKAFGESMVFQLKNGHFVIVDGAQEKNSQLTVEYLVANAPKGEIPVVDAWFFTHAHPDHIYCAMGIGEDPTLNAQIRVEGVYFTWPNDAGVRRESAYNDLCGQIARTNEAMKNFRTSDGKVTPQFKLHAGQRFYLAGMEVQVLATQDQLFPSQYFSYNCSSTSYRFIVGDQDLLIMGDAHQPVCERLMEFYGNEVVLSPTFFQTLHHTYNDVPAFFKYIAPEYMVVTGNSIGNHEGYNWLKQTVKKIFYAGDPEIVFPYAG